jgi:hypothetical protein
VTLFSLFSPYRVKSHVNDRAAWKCKHARQGESNETAAVKQHETHEAQNTTLDIIAIEHTPLIIRFFLYNITHVDNFFQNNFPFTTHVNNRAARKCKHARQGESNETAAVKQHEMHETQNTTLDITTIEHTPLIIRFFLYNITHADNFFQNNFPFTAIHTGRGWILPINKGPPHTRRNSPGSIR